MGTRPLLLGHRGTCRSASVRENTFNAFNLALTRGCDGFEFDVRLTADRVAVVCHDPEYRGLAIWKTEFPRIPEIPSLNAVLERYADSAFLDIELKEPGLGALLLEALKENTPRRGFVVSSFLPEVLAEVRGLSATAPLGFIFDREKGLQLGRDLPVEYVVPHHSLISQAYVNEAHETGKKIVAWTVNDAKEMLRLAEWEVDGIISDRPDLLARTLGPGRAGLP
jgi:glycerophosphoryl diester phosphodiesterase